jgi:hypothetical protein
MRAQRIEALLEEARRSLESGAVDLVFDLCQQALVLDPENAAAQDLSARAQAELEHHQIEAVLADARAAFARDDFHRAFQLVGQALAINPNSSPALELRKDVDEARKRYEAQQQRDRAIRDAIERAEFALAQRAYESAIRFADEALEIEPRDQRALDLRQQAVDTLEAQRHPATAERAGLVADIERRAFAARPATSISPADAQTIVTPPPPGSELLPPAAAAEKTLVVPAPAELSAAERITSGDETLVVAPPSPAASIASPPPPIAPQPAPASAAPPGRPAGITASPPAATAAPPVSASGVAVPRAAAKVAARPAARHATAVRPLPAAPKAPVRKEPWFTSKGALGSVAATAMIAALIGIVGVMRSARTPVTTPPSTFGTLALNVLPWANVKITRKQDGRSVHGCSTTPCVVSLPADVYNVTATNPVLGDSIDFEITINSGQTRTETRPLLNFNPEDEIKRILRSGE